MVIEPNERTVVFGGTGRTGREIVTKLVRDGVPVRVVARRSDAARERFSDDVEVVGGDITDAESVRAAVSGAGSVVIVVESAESDDAPNGPERVHYEGTQHVIDAAGADVHILLVTQIYITRPEAFAAVANVIRWRGRAEEALRRSGRPYTIVRPAWLTGGSGGGVRLEQGDQGEGRVSRERVAEVCVQALRHPEARGRTFELYGADGSEPADWAAAFAALEPDGVAETS